MPTDDYDIDTTKWIIVLDDNESYSSKEWQGDIEFDEDFDIEDILGIF